jgi:hypothetical protein
MNIITLTIIPTWSVAVSMLILVVAAVITGRLSNF